MSNIHNKRERLAELGLARFGKDVFVVGVPYKAIITDEEEDDETGYRRELLASFSFLYSEVIKTGDSVVYEAENYVVGRRQRVNSLDQYYTVELKRA